LARAMNLPAKEGVMIARVASGSPAERAGLRGAQKRVRVRNYIFAVGGDIIVALDGHKIQTVDELTGFLDENKKPGEEIQVDILRDGKPMTLGARLGEIPEE